MGFYRRIKYFLVHTLKYGNKEAQNLIEKGCVSIDGLKIYENCIINDHSAIYVNDEVARVKKEFVYILFNKPAGYESTLNKNINKNISVFFDGFEDLAIAGRLDKQSHGLMLLSNDGKWVEKLCNPKFEKEKEYIVVLDKPVNISFIAAFSNGVEIDKRVTKKCFCEALEDTFTIRVILTEGKNRQIRKMCMVLGYTVLNLKRIRIERFLLDNLEEGKYKFTII